jgi:glucose/arabinose dehydrogenase
MPLLDDSRTNDSDASGRSSALIAAGVLAVVIVAALATWGARRAAGRRRRWASRVCDRAGTRQGSHHHRSTREAWAIAFLPDGDVLVTELRGCLRVVRGGRLLPQSIEGIPPVETRDQAGLMDLALHPQFANNRFVYFTYSKKGSLGNTGSRIAFDGSVPADSPFAGRPGVRAEIFAAGVRNPQGLFVDRESGTMWEHEFGPLGGDELNILLAGHNYGWPLITYGKNYDGTNISIETAREGLDQPVAYWVPSISPSGLTVYRGDRFPAWRGNIFLGALSGTHLRRLVIDNGKVAHQEEIRIPPLRTRVRDVREGPDGLLYVLTERGALRRLEPSETPQSLNKQPNHQLTKSPDD